MTPLQLEECRAILDDDEIFERFIEWFIPRLKGDFAPIMYQHKVLGSFVSADITKEMIYDRITRRLLESPTILEDIENRFKNEPIVE